MKGCNVYKKDPKCYKHRSSYAVMFLILLVTSFRVGTLTDPALYNYKLFVAAILIAELMITIFIILCDFNDYISYNISAIRIKKWDYERRISYKDIDYFNIQANGWGRIRNFGNATIALKSGEIIELYSFKNLRKIRVNWFKYSMMTKEIEEMHSNESEDLLQDDRGNEYGKGSN